MKVVAIIQCRLNSRRLPRKALELIAGRPLIDHVLERALAIKGVDRVALNVPKDDVREFLDVREQVPRNPPYIVMGMPNQEQDVLGSYLACAVANKADVIMRLTGDCPLLCPELCARVLQLYKQLNDPRVYCANDTFRSGYPDGTDVEVFSVHALRAASDCAESPFEREHVTPWLRSELPNYGVLAPYEWEDNILREVKWSVDTEADLGVVRGIYEYLRPEQLSVSDTAFAYRAMAQDIEASRERN